MSRIDSAFINAPRANFLPDSLVGQADLDMSLPIGYGQTNSQPSTVAQMLDWLEVEPGDKVLDVGSGSGWTTALLANLVGDSGMVYAVELVPELVEFGRENCKRMRLNNVSFHHAKAEIGLSEYAPYDRILVSAAANSLPESLLDQLKDGGKLVIPIQNDIQEITKSTSKDREVKNHPGYIFVPLIS